jgi:hypothetical protein
VLRPCQCPDQPPIRYSHLIESQLLTCTEWIATSRVWLTCCYPPLPALYLPLPAEQNWSFFDAAVAALGPRLRKLAPVLQLVLQATHLLDEKYYSGYRPFITDGLVKLAERLRPLSSWGGAGRQGCCEWSCKHRSVYINIGLPPLLEALAPQICPVCVSAAV